MADVSGSISGLILDGISFDVQAEADLNQMGSGFENTSQASSGRNMLKKVKRVQTIEDVVLITSVEEDELLKELADRNDPFPISYIDAAGNTFVARDGGNIDYVNRTTQDNTSTIRLLPRTDWEAFSIG